MIKLRRNKSRKSALKRAAETVQESHLDGSVAGDQLAGKSVDTKIDTRMSQTILDHRSIEAIVGRNYTLDEEDTERKFQFIADSLEAQQADEDEDQLEMYEGFITAFSTIAESKFRIRETLKHFAQQFLIAAQDRSDAFCQGLLAGLLFANKAIEITQDALLNAMRQAFATYERFKTQWIELLNAKSMDQAMEDAKARS